MKKSIFPLSLLMLITFALPNTISATETPSLVTVATTINTETKSQEEITARIQEIKKMDRSKMSKSERKELKNELRQMKKLSDGVYLSGGALLIVVILLILLL